MADFLDINALRKGADQLRAEDFEKKESSLLAAVDVINLDPKDEVSDSQETGLQHAFADLFKDKEVDSLLMGRDPEDNERGYTVYISREKIILQIGEAENKKKYELIVGTNNLTLNNQEADRPKFVGLLKKSMAEVKNKKARFFIGKKK